MEPVVQLRGAVTLLGRFPALAGIDLEVAAGEVLLLRGPNGAGKTTLLRCCAGLAPLARGGARVLGHDLTDRRQARALRRRVGLLGHATGLYDELTVADNVRFWGRPRAPARRTSTPRSTRAGSAGALASSPVARLSAGQRRAPPSPACSPGAPSCGFSTSRTPGSTRTGGTCSTSSSTTPRPPAPRSCWPRTSSIVPRPSPTASSPSPAAPSRRRASAPTPRSAVLVP